VWTAGFGKCRVDEVCCYCTCLPYVVAKALKLVHLKGAPRAPPYM